MQQLPREDRGTGWFLGTILSVNKTLHRAYAGHTGASVCDTRGLESYG